ncbi:MAG: hypothetical protein ACW963_07425 [Candidatus Sifarchaeia archaeon]
MDKHAPTIEAQLLTETLLFDNVLLASPHLTFDFAYKRILLFQNELFLFLIDTDVNKTEEYLDRLYNRTIEEEFSEYSYLSAIENAAFTMMSRSESIARYASELYEIDISKIGALEKYEAMLKFYETLSPQVINRQYSLKDLHDAYSDNPFKDREKVFDIVKALFERNEEEFEKFYMLVPEDEKELSFRTIHRAPLISDACFLRKNNDIFPVISCFEEAQDLNPLFFANFKEVETIHEYLKIVKEDKTCKELIDDGIEKEISTIVNFELAKPHFELENDQILRIRKAKETETLRISLTELIKEIETGNLEKACAIKKELIESELPDSVSTIISDSSKEFSKSTNEKMKVSYGCTLIIPLMLFMDLERDEISFIINKETNEYLRQHPHFYVQEHRDEYASFGIRSLQLLFEEDIGTDYHFFFYSP